jgi:polar amino acid transport system substrate-binding protein
MDDLPHMTTLPRLQCVGILLAVIALLIVPAAAGVPYKLPRFRSELPQAAIPELPPGTSIRLLADEDFPPFSFRARDGAMAGLAVELAMAACTELHVTCQVVPGPLPDLLPMLRLKQGDVVISGPRIDTQTLADATMTRPWFRSMGRFAILTGKPIDATDARALGGKRIAVVRASSHEAWLTRYYGGADIVAFDDLAAAEEALRTGSVDILFGDGLQIIYWVEGSASHGCCRLVGGAYSDFGTFSRNYAFVLRSTDLSLRDAFDWALDRMQANGTTERLFNTYVPLSPW